MSDVKDLAEKLGVDHEALHAGVQKLEKPSPPAVPSTTTVEQDRTTAEQRFQDNLTGHGQRRINFIWEFTQASIALVFSIGVITIFVLVALHTGAIFPPGLESIMTLIIREYFARTNHVKVGGVGPKTGEHRGD